MKPAQNPARNQGVVLVLWLLILIAFTGSAVLYQVLNAGEVSAAILKDTFGLVSLLAGAAGLLILVRYSGLFDMSRTKAGVRDKVGFVLASLGLITALLSLLN